MTNSGESAAKAGPFLVDAVKVYHPVEQDQLLQRHIQKLHTGSRSALRFAKQIIGSYGDEAVPALVEGLRLELEEHDTVAANFLSALSYTQTEQTLPILLEVLDKHSVPMVRSQAIDTISVLKQQGLLEGLLEHADRESDSGPQMRIMPCLGSLGGDEAAAFLANIVRRWLSDSVTDGRGTSAWEGLIEMEGEEALPHIEELVEDLPPVMRYSGYLRLVLGGRTQWLDSVRAMMDHKAVGKAELRRRATILLCQQGDWESAAKAAMDPDPGVRAAYINGLREKEGELSAEEQAYLVEISASASKDAAYPALRALLERGDRVHLEPWLAQVKGYPTRAGSIDALHLFLQEGISHPRLVPMLMERWPYCEVDFRIDITRVMAMHATLESVQFLEQVVSNSDEEPDVRLYAMTSLGNSGELCVPSLFRIWEQKPSPSTTDRLFNSLLRYAELDEVRNFCFELVIDPEAPDFAKALMLAKLPVSFKEEAYQPLLAARAADEREEVRQYIDAILYEFF